MLANTAVAYPSRPKIIEERNRTIVIFQNKPCRPVDPSHLHYQMGDLFDTSRMAMDEGTVKRSSLKERSLEIDEEDFKEEEIEIVSESDGDEEEDEIDDSVTDSEKRLETSLEKLKNDKLKERTVTVKDWSENPQSPAYLDSMKFMRRKRDADLDESRTSEDASTEAVKTYYQKLMEHKNLKRFIRKAKKLKKKNKLPWTCKMKKVWLRMDEGYFPPYIRSAECRSKKCFFDLNECIPKKYTIRLLRRDPKRCNPVPNTGIDTTYEEVWFFDRYHVTVWCDCGIAKVKKRRKSRNRKLGRP